MQSLAGQSPTALTLVQLLHDYVSGKLTPAISFLGDETPLKSCSYLDEKTGHRCIIGQYLDDEDIAMIEEFELGGVCELLDFEYGCEQPFLYLDENLPKSILSCAQQLHDGLVTEEMLTAAGIDLCHLDNLRYTQSAWLSLFDQLSQELALFLAKFSDGDELTKCMGILGDTYDAYVQNYGAKSDEV